MNALTTAPVAILVGAMSEVLHHMHCVIHDIIAKPADRQSWTVADNCWLVNCQRWTFCLAPVLRLSWSRDRGMHACSSCSNVAYHGALQSWYACYAVALVQSISCLHSKRHNPKPPDSPSISCLWTCWLGGSVSTK